MNWGIVTFLVFTGICISLLAPALLAAWQVLRELA